MDTHSSTLRAAAWMAGWLALMLTMAVAGREATRELDVFQVMLMRSVLGIALVYPLVRRAGGLAAMRTRHPWRHMWRNGVHYCAQYSWFVALGLIPLAQVISIEFTMPLWTALLATAFLGERMSAGKIMAVVLGLVGVWIIVRPEAGHANEGQLWALAAAVGFGISVVMVKALTRTDSVVRIIFWMLVIQSLIGVVPAALVWQAVPANAWGWIAIVAFCGAFSHYCMAQAMVYADATLVVPMDFLRVPLTALAGWAIYSEPVDMFTAIGAALILGGNLLNIRSAGTARLR